MGLHHKPVIAYGTGCQLDLAFHLLLRSIDRKDLLGNGRGALERHPPLRRAIRGGEDGGADLQSGRIFESLRQ